MLATGSVALPIPGVEFGDRVDRHLGRLVAAGAAEDARRRRRRRLGLRDRLRLRPLRHRGDPDRDARPDPPRRGQGHGPGRRARLQEAGHRRSPPATPVENVEAGKSAVKVTYGDESAEVDYLCIAGGRGPDIEGARARRGRGQARGERQDQGRRVPADLEPEGLRDRRPGHAHGARPQGLRGGRRRGRARRRRRDPPGRPEPGRRRHLLPPAGRQRRPDRGGGQGGRATRSRSASSSSAASAARPSTTTERAWSRSSPTPSTARSSAPTSSATAPAT